ESTASHISKCWWHDPVIPSTCRAHLPGAGIFQCSMTGLGFKVNSAADEEMWAPAGPLFNIKVQPMVVLEVHLPHFICLTEGVDTSQCSIAHFKSKNMILKRPTRVVTFSAVLRNPSFSLLGVLWRKLHSTLNSFPMHSLVLIYQQLRAANTTFHLYLIPDDKSVKQAHLPFCYKSPKEQQLFVEIYINNMEEEIGLLMTNTRRNSSTVMDALSLLGEAFLKKHKAKLCSRMRQLTILLHLRNANVINSDEEEELRSQNKSVTRNLIWLDLIEKKGLEAQEQLYQTLRLKDPYLIADLENSS
uniref:Uncharacterized protein n=1 Tax=Melopsittacus undulatus TaxID=13146 RepID=A0A8V5GWK3_MELUD